MTLDKWNFTAVTISTTIGTESLVSRQEYVLLARHDTSTSIRMTQLSILFNMVKKDLRGSYQYDMR